MLILRNYHRKKRSYKWVVPWAIATFVLLALDGCAPGCITPNVSYPCTLI